MKNITVAVPDEVYHQARIRAAERSTSVSALVAGYLERLSADDTEFEQLAELQQRVQDIAAKSGATLASTEALAAEAAGGYRRIRMRVALTARWPVLVAMLQALAEQASPQMLVDDVQLRSAPVLLDRDDPPLDASFTVLALRAGAEPAAAATR